MARVCLSFMRLPTPYLHVDNKEVKACQLASAWAYGKWAGRTAERCHAGTKKKQQVATYVLNAAAEAKQIGRRSSITSQQQEQDLHLWQDTTIPSIHAHPLDVVVFSKYE